MDICSPRVGEIFKVRETKLEGVQKVHVDVLDLERRFIFDFFHIFDIFRMFL